MCRIHAISIAGAVLLAAVASSSVSAQNIDWPTYAGDLNASRYRAFDQINASNFSRLEIRWRFKTDHIGPRPEFKLEGTPLEVGGRLYATAGSRRGVIALDALTGELLWMHTEHEGARGAAAPRQLSGRGLAFWSDAGDERVIYVTPGYRMIALDAKTGQPVTGFGTSGAVDLKSDFDQEILPDLTTGEVGIQSAPTVAGNIVLVGAAFREGFAPKSFRNNKGYVRAYDVRTGKRLWTFHTIPKNGEPGYETWLKGSAEYNGNAGVWTQITADLDAGLAYLPVEAPTSDFYGGHRPGNGLYGNSLVAVDLKTGRLKWYFQLVHHDIWDYDISAAPLLIDITVNGNPIKAVAQPTKQGILYVLDRISGKPVWPIPEKAVPRGDVPGEWYAPTQPIPSRPAAYARTGVLPEMLIDFTPEMRQRALSLTNNYRFGPIYTPPVLSRAVPRQLATLMLGPVDGGTNWPGGSFNPESHTVFVYACNACLEPIALVPPMPRQTDLRYVEGLVGKSASEDQSLTIDGLPILKPPYGTITAIDLNSGDIRWQIPHGETPDSVRNHSALGGMTIPRTGQPVFNIGTLVTKNLVIAGEGLVTKTLEHPRGAMLRAYAQDTGREVGAVWMPAPQGGSPMTYMIDGKQYIVVAVSGGNYSGEYICFALPSKGNTVAAVPVEDPQSMSSSVLDGVYTEAQASRGESAFAQSCASCHGAMLRGVGEAPALVGARFISNFDGLSVGSLFDRIRATMPINAPNSLERDQYVNILAFLLKANDFPAGRTDLFDRSDFLRAIRFEPTTGAASQ